MDSFWIIFKQFSDKINVLVYKSKKPLLYQEDFLKDTGSALCFGLLSDWSLASMEKVTVPAPLKAADTIQKLCFVPSDYHIKLQ